MKNKWEMYKIKITDWFTIIYFILNEKNVNAIKIHIKKKMMKFKLVIVISYFKLISIITKKLNFIY